MADLKLVSNRSGEVRRETLAGREYLVAPVVAIRAGVLNGELVPLDEIGAFVEAWNGIPLPLGHPTQRGIPISANTPELEATLSVGRFWNAEMDGDRLRGEVWVDIAKAQAMGGDALEVLERLENNEGIEVSTAYFRDLEEADGQLNGQRYIGIQRNLRPDHLALLLHDIGACSWKDGCGVPRVNAASRAHKPDYSGTETTSWAEVAKTFAAYRDGYYKHSGTKKPEDDAPGTCADAPAAMKRWIASKSLLGDAGSNDFGELLFFPVVNPSTDKLNAGALRAVLGGRGSQADIPAAALESAQNMARKLLEDEFGAADKKETEANTRRLTGNQQHTGVMVALFPPDSAAAALAITGEQLPEGASPIPASDMHLTLGYLGDLEKGEVTFDHRWLLNAVMDFARNSVVVQGKVNGIARFNGTDENGQQALVALFDCEYLPAWRDWLTAGLPIKRNHGFMPHITLAYLPAEAPTPNILPGPMEIVFDRIGVSWGGQVTLFALQGEAGPIDPGEAMAAQSQKQGFNPVTLARNALRSLAGVLGFPTEGRAADPFQNAAPDGVVHSEEVLMTKKAELIDKLIANKRCVLDKNDLELMGESGLEKLLNALEKGGCPGSEAAKTDPPATNAADDTQGAEQAVSAEMRELTAALAEMGGVEGLKAAIAAVQANANQHKADLVNELKANERCAFAEADLLAMSVDQLEKLATSMRPANYAGRGGPRGNAGAEAHQTPEPPKVIMGDLSA